MAVGGLMILVIAAATPMASSKRAYEGDVHDLEDYVNANLDAKRSYLHSNLGLTHKKFKKDLSSEAMWTTKFYDEQHTESPDHGTIKIMEAELPMVTSHDKFAKEWGKNDPTSAEHLGASKAEFVAGFAAAQRKIEVAAKRSNVPETDTECSSPVYTDASEDNFQLPEIYGGGVRIVGLSNCKKYRASSIKRWNVAGMPNSGTNALYTSLTDNCIAPANSVGWEVPWKKHEFLHHAGANKSKSFMAVALVKDPLQWMASTCRKPYFMLHKSKAETCPSPVSSTEAQYFHEAKKESLVAIWGKWVHEYLKNEISEANDLMENDSQPALMIRYEDFLFKPEQTISKVCECLGFESKRGKDFRILESIPKCGRGHGHPSNRSQTMAQYTEKRSALLSLFTGEDWKYIRAVLRSTQGDKILNEFHYNFQEIGSSYLQIDSKADIQLLLATEDWGDGEE